MKDLEQLKRDLVVALEAETKLKEIKTRNISSPVDELIDYAVRCDKISSTMDVINIVRDFPQLEKRVSKAYDERIKAKEKAKKESERARREEIRKYGGTYDRYEDVPGYGTEWNMRCIPEGVHIRGGGRNSRC